MRLFRLTELSPPHDVPGNARLASAEDRAQIVAWFKAFTAEAGGILGDVEVVVDEILRSGAHWLWIDGDRPVALASRRSVESGSARIGPVYTPPGERGRGYGSAATSAATRDVLDRRRDPGAVHRPGQPDLEQDLSGPRLRGGRRPGRDHPRLRSVTRPVRRSAPARTTRAPGGRRRACPRRRACRTSPAGLRMRRRTPRRRRRSSTGRRC